jgi:hypothetical protein
MSKITIFKDLREVYLIYIQLFLIEYKRGANKKKIMEITSLLKKKVEYCNQQIDKLSTEIACNLK